jgi:RNA polymerase sigma factor (sigma-70 family)
MDDLIRRAQHHDHEAFRQIVERYHDLVARTARSLLGNRALAEDAAQEAWLDVWRGLSRFQSGAAFRPWLLAIVANRCRMLMRRAALATTTLEDGEAMLLPSADDVVWSAIRRETGKEILTALKTLSPEHRRVLALRYFADLDIGEIAAVLGIPDGTVKSRLHRALANIRAAMPEHTPSERHS